MPVNDDQKYGRATRWFCMNPDMSMSEAMRAAGFTDEEAMNRTFHKRVRRRPEYEQLNNDLNGVFDSVATVENGKEAIDIDPPALNGTPPAVAMVPVGIAPDPITTTPVAQATTKRNQTRSSSSQKMKKLVAKKRAKVKASAATKEATKMLAREWSKKESSNNMTSPQIGARKICVQVNRKHQTNISSRTITRYTNRGLIGISPLKRGPEGDVSDRIMKVLVRAFESYVQINQGNGNGAVILEWKHLCKRLNLVASPLFFEPKYSDRLYIRILEQTTIEFGVHVQEMVEDRRIRWTTYANLRLWFETWGEDLVELGFAHKDDDDKIIITHEQLIRLDE